MQLTKIGADYKIPVSIPGLKFYHAPEPFVLEHGGVLADLRIAYHTYGTLNATGDNVIWVCHALTANSDVADWWSGLFGEGNVFDPKRYYIVCANIIGSCYGSTCAESINPVTGKPYGKDFPLVSIRDIGRSHDMLREHLGVREIALCIGGSCGGHQALEFAALASATVRKLALLVCAARESAWAIAIHETQRMAIMADASTWSDEEGAGAAGLRAARAVGLLSYRTIEAYRDTQSDTEDTSTEFRAASYQRYQGEKLVKRFYASCYYHLTRTLDTHQVGRGRKGAAAALSFLSLPTYVFSIQEDMLIPPFEQEFLAKHLPNVQYCSYSSKFGHDGFLIETEFLRGELLAFLG